MWSSVFQGVCSFQVVALVGKWMTLVTNASVSRNDIATEFFNVPEEPLNVPEGCNTLLSM